MSANLESSAVVTGLEKVSFHSNPKGRQCQRIYKLYTVVLISPASKVILKILQARLQKHVKILRRGGKNTQKNCTKKIFTTQIIMVV